MSGPGLVAVQDGSVSFDDDQLGSLAIEKLGARLLRDGPGHAEAEGLRVQLAAGPSSQARRVQVDLALRGNRLAGLPAVTVEQGSVTVWRGFAVSGIQGKVTPDPADAERATIELKGGYGGVDRVLWDARGWVKPVRREGHLDLAAARFDLAQLKPILEGTPVIDPETTGIDANLRLDYHGDGKDAREDAVEFRGDLHVSRLSVFHPMLGPLPVRDLTFGVDVRGQLRPRQRVLRVERAQFDYRGVSALLTLHAEKLGRKPAVDTWLKITPLPCQAALESLPAELTPSLRGFRLQGTFATELHLAVDLSDLDQGVVLDGSVGIDGCKVLDAPEAMSAARLREPFEHAAEAWPGEWRVFTVGPESPDWVPYAEISPHIVNSLMTTEDSTFMRHKGFIVSEFRSALKQNLERGYFRLGASSITMQMVKNVLLSREKTLSRKLQELFLTWYVERQLGKERILEIYLNAIEFGPGVFGIGRATRHYYGKPPRAVTPREAAWFSSILPNPKRRYVHFCKGAPDAKWEAYINRILKRMHERGRLTDGEYEDALRSHLAFSRAEALPERECLDLIKRITTPLPAGKEAPPEDEEAAD